LRHALLQKPLRTVIYVSSKLHHAWLFRVNVRRDGHDVIPFRKQDLERLADLDDPRAVLICDSIAPPNEAAAFTVMLTSPRRDRWTEFSTAPKCTQLVFPPFSWDEMREMRDTCFPDMSDKELLDRYDEFGGVPRMAFHFTLAAAKKEMSTALTKVDLQQLPGDMFAGEVESAHHSHRLLHMVPRGWQPGSSVSPRQVEYYEPWCSQFASRHVAEKLYTRYEEAASVRLHQLLAKGPSSGEESVFYGNVYEQAALGVLQRGGTFARFDVQSDTEETAWTLRKASSVVYADSVADIAAKHAEDKQRLILPRNKSFTAVDAILPGGRMANVTINVKHEVKLRGKGNRSAEGLLPCADALGVGGSGPIDLYWVVPKARYDELKRMNAERKAGGTSASLFSLILPEEQAMYAHMKQLEKEFKDAAAAAKPAAEVEHAEEAMATWKSKKKTSEKCKTEQVTERPSAARAKLHKYKASMAQSVAEWKVIHKRVRHYIVCVQFSSVPSPPP
jgi:hypothetical protein